MNNPKCWFGKMYEEDKYARERIISYAELIKPYLGKGKRLLDIGCYTAKIYDYLPKDIKYLGLDFDEAALKIAQDKGASVKYLRFDINKINLNDKFDIIIAAETLEHLLDPENLISQIQVLLAENGIVVISLPNECTLYHRIICLIGKGVDMCAFQLYKHLHLPTISQSRNFVKKYFEIIKESYYINPLGKGSRWEALGGIATKIPDGFWRCLAKLFPGLFARGVIFLCRHKTNK
ncbi:MAG: class I SAM-dependent methyltransferase [Candidatus Omnitrophota bacterium]